MSAGPLQQYPFLRIGDLFIHLTNVAHIEIKEEPEYPYSTPTVHITYNAVGPEGVMPGYVLSGKEAEAIIPTLREYLGAFTLLIIDRPKKEVAE